MPAIGTRRQARFTNTSHDHDTVRRLLTSVNPARSMIPIISVGG
jgi:hypothetical protein